MPSIGDDLVRLTYQQGRRIVYHDGSLPEGAGTNEVGNHTGGYLIAPDSWPNTFIAGAPKAGTTSLFRYLEGHPEIDASRIKEPRFFVKDDPWIRTRGQQCVSTEEAYLALFEGGSTAPIRLEASPEYQWLQGVPERIAARCPDARILFLLRDPVERAFSHWLMERRLGEEERSFLDVVTVPHTGELAEPYVRPGFYGRDLRRWRKHFPPAQTHVVLSEDLFADTKETLRAVCRFLAIDESPVDRIDTSRLHNPYREPRNRLAKIIFGNRRIRHLSRKLLPDRLVTAVRDWAILGPNDKPTLDPKAREYLVRIYQPDVADLERLLDRDLSALRQSWGPAADVEDGQPP